MYQTDSWKILAPSNNRKFSIENINFTEGKPIIKNPDLEAHIKSVWEKELKNAEKKRIILTDNPLIRYNSFEENDKLTVEISMTNYPEWRATWLSNNRAVFKENFNRDLLPTETAGSFAAATLPLTLDNYLIFLERSSQVSLFGGLLSIPSGGKWNGNPANVFETLLKDKTKLPYIIREIVAKELGYFPEIDGKENPIFLALDEAIEDGYAIQFGLNLNRELSDVQEQKYKIKGDGKKYTGNIVHVRFTENDLADFLKVNWNRIPSSIQPGVIMVGAHKFGDDWPLYIKGVRKI